MPEVVTAPPPPPPVWGVGPLMIVLIEVEPGTRPTRVAEMLSIGSKIGELFTVIIPTYNGVRFISDTLDPAVAQTRTPIEVVDVDDGSSDGAVQFATRWFAADRDGGQVTGRLYCQAHRGGGAARTLGVASAMRAWIQFLDSDDLPTPEKNARQLGLLDEAKRTVEHCAWRLLEATPERFGTVTSRSSSTKFVLRRSGLNTRPRSNAEWGMNIRHERLTMAGVPNRFQRTIRRSEGI